MTQQLIPLRDVVLEYFASMRVTWRGEVVRIVSARGDKVQIARKGVGLRWVRVDALEVGCGEASDDLR